MLKLGLLFFSPIFAPLATAAQSLFGAGKRRTFVPELPPGHNNAHSIFNIAGKLLFGAH